VKGSEVAVLRCVTAPPHRDHRELEQAAMKDILELAFFVAVVLAIAWLLSGAAWMLFL
jgi:hypothetical protein